MASGYKYFEAFDLREMAGHRIAGRYKPTQMIGYGSFGVVYKGTLPEEEDEKIAIKLEYKRRNGGQRERLLGEFIKYVVLADGPGVPIVFGFGTCRNLNYLAMELLGPSLDIVMAGKELPVKRAFNLAVKMFEALQHIHSKGIVHRDLKPENMVLGIDENSDTVFIIDFGEATYFINKETKIHKEMRKEHLVGTTSYASVNGLQDRAVSRRDDLESLGYVIIEMVKGTLPWMHIHTDRNAVLETKQWPVERLCEGCPQQVLDYMDYCRNMEFKEEPNYDMIIKMFKGEEGDNFTTNLNV